MITTKELQYVDSWASKIPMPGIEYSLKVMQEIKECYELFERLYRNKEYSFIFSNGEEIEFEILSKNLCHMLGIDYKNIKGEYFREYRKRILGTEASDFSSYDLLTHLIEKMHEVVEHDNDISTKEKAINYYKSGIKCQIFKKLSDFDKFNFAAINYNPGDGKYDYGNQKVLFVPSNEAVCPYFMIGINKDDSDQRQESYDNDTQYLQDIRIPKFYVSTLFAPANPVKYFVGVQVIIPTQILVSDNDKLSRFNATPSEKLQLLTMYKNIINTYRLAFTINIFLDYESTLKERSDESKLIRILK